jgi:regulator of protease activity HflC (stomatin/prohibitin superfamily)
MNYVLVPQSHVGLLYRDGVFIEQLSPGRYKLKRGFFSRVENEVRIIDMRERTLMIKGQEILTADKVAIRVSLLIFFRVRDAQAALHNVASYEERIYEDVQLAARRFLASRKLDAILNDRNEISDSVSAVVDGSANGYGVQVMRAEVKDLVFPGNLREIMNRVLETERKAEAQLIQARKEAEALAISTEAEREAARSKLELQREQIRSRAEAEREADAMRLATEREQAAAIAETPSLLTLRELHTLREMAQNGARFAVGLSTERLTRLLELPKTGG